jgi:hypothetical protein
MRHLLKVTLPVEKANEHVRKGTLGSTIQECLKEMHAEAAYFTDVDGARGGYIFFDLSDPSHIPAIVEPWMLAFNAKIEIHPVMTPDDLAKAGPSIERAAKKHG